MSATLTLLESKLRKDAKITRDAVYDDEYLLSVSPSRTVTIATSTAQNDGGVFRLDFRDERYMPFEGAGAVESKWRLELPKNFHPFNYSTINDVILHISYTAEYDGNFRKEIEAENKRLDTLLTHADFSMPRAFSFRQEFSQTFHRLLHSPEGETIPLELSERHFPLFLQGKHLVINTASLVLELDKNGFRDGSSGEPIPLPGVINLEATIQGNGTEETVITRFDQDPVTGMYSADINPATFTDFVPSASPFRVTLRITNAGDLAPGERPASDPSALDDHKVKDLYLLIRYRIYRGSR